MRTAGTVPIVRMGIGMGHLPLNTRLMYFDLLKLNVSAT